MKVYVIILTSLFLFVSLIFITPSNEAYGAVTRCLKPMKGPWARGLFKRTVRKRAILRWNVSVRLRRGGRFAKWRDAKRRRIVCRKKGRRHHCRAIGSPCGVVYN